MPGTLTLGLRYFLCPGGGGCIASRRPDRPAALFALVVELFDVGERRRIEASERLRAPPKGRIEEVEGEIVLDVPDVPPGQELRLAGRRPAAQHLGNLAVVGEARMRGAQEVPVADHGRPGGE